MKRPLASAGVDVAVIGAGVAGLAAAATLRRAGRSCIILEAGNRIGGRAFTEHPAMFGGRTPFDHGASWLHDAGRNPLIAVAQAHGESVRPDTPWEERVRLLTETGARAAMPEYEAAEERWRKTVTAKLSGPDCSLAEAGAPVAGDPWTPTIENWEGAIIAAADADVLSLRDWHANQLDGENYVAPHGLGATLGRCLGAQAGRVSLRTRVSAITARADDLDILTESGDTLRASSVIVTVSTGVLRAGTIKFTPALPAEKLAALDGLPMGLLTKIVLKAAGTDRLGLPPGTDVVRRVQTRFAPGLSIIFWPDGTDLAIGFLGGRAAWQVAGHNQDAAEMMRAEIDSALGSRAKHAFAPDSALVTGWGTDPCFLGAYAYATPGNAGARAALAAPIWNGRLSFAGEACAADGLAGTVAGAYLAGQRAAEEAASAWG
jgi:monoamine oxidase